MTEPEEGDGGFVPLSGTMGEQHPQPGTERYTLAQYRELYAVNPEEATRARIQGRVRPTAQELETLGREDRAHAKWFKNYPVGQQQEETEMAEDQNRPNEPVVEVVDPVFNMGADQSEDASPEDETESGSAKGLRQPDLTVSPPVKDHGQKPREGTKK